MEDANIHTTQRESEKMVYDKMVSVLGKERADSFIFR